MATAQLVLILVAALAFVLIGLEELPVRVNVARVQRNVSRRARRRGVQPAELLSNMRRNTRRSVWILLGFAIASSLLLLVRLRSVPPTSPAWTVEAPLHAFAAVLVLGLLFLAFAFYAWAPRLLDQVAAVFATAGSNGDASLDVPKTPHGDDPRLP